MSDLESCEKVFIPVHTETKPHCGHFYLYIIHVKNEEIEIWDSLLDTCVAETDRDENTRKLLLAMEKLFVNVAFTGFRSKMKTDILKQPNGFDCGIFVMKFTEQSYNYVKINPSFQFGSEKERDDLALKLLNSDLNQEKRNLYGKARRHYAQKQDGNKRLRVDRVIRQDRLEEGSSKDYILPTTDLIGRNFQNDAKQIWEWIMGDKVSAIGIWEMGGSGKTALATHIHDKLLEEANGDIKVIWLTVSQNIDIYKLQKVIAKSIKLDISDEPRKRIARKLFQTFKEMKNCVIILDDVWDHFSLKDVGFPMSDNRIKLILTTRIGEVCQGMGCEEVIKVKPLDEEDSRTLFDEFFGLFREELSSEVENISWFVENIAQNVVQECEGFPLAIVRIATSMKGKTKAVEWRHMLECLKNLGNGQYEMDKWVFPVLRSSYDFLTNKLQKFLLYWVLRIGTNNLCFEDNIHYFIRRFVYESIDETMELSVQYDEGYNMLLKLKNHSMLDYDDYGYLIINKFLRVLATGIAEDTGKIMRKAYKNLIEIPSDDQWKEDLQQVFLTGNKIQAIPCGTCPNCTQLSMLLLNGNKELNHITDEFFNNMPALKTLDLSETAIWCLPKSVSNLKYLITLLLSRCTELRDIPSLGKLKRLISLDLSWAAITEAPVGLESLVSLRWLSLLEIDEWVISPLLISKLINLECLELGDAQCLTDATVQSIQGLKKLEVICAYFHDISIFNTFVKFMAENRVIRSYQLTLYSALYDYLGGLDDQIKREYSMKKIILKGMNFKNREPVVLPRDIKELFITACFLGTGVRSPCNILSYAHNNNPPQIELCISDCEDVECLCCCSCPFCSSSQLVGRLHLWKMDNLKDLVSPSADSLHQSALFSQLTDLQILYCESMNTLMPFELLALLQNLRTIWVERCEQMKEIVGDVHPVMEHTIKLPMLTSLTLLVMPELESVCTGILHCPSLRKFSANYCKKLNPPRIAISNDESVPPMKKNSSGTYYWQK
ncbi:probable disease resistance protein At4g27220 [Neltuma alba]|uniref:probable disease resistance protein At4g27220 n=1 Tax=Neltuma alba TaxID=207710 RepID=UPI0010A4A5B3|nr:probable disease resistance protein At4g27220 [Prosopis alba]